MTLPANRTANQNDAGFSLFESLVALAIFATVAIATMTLITQNIRSSGLMAARTYAEFVAENVLVETYLNDRLTLGGSQGETVMGGYDFEWRRDIQNTSEAGLLGVTVRVSLGDSEQTLVLRYGFRRE
ncbi:type II secretion system minor pseudopilin GspI [Ponticaulis koreensis]|uniref:type II secretion system minor pseudopilin GspI n=1 Tax=Ponticaulis koreensis TaxID=1123045 RepID=UPI0003B42AE1|nr:type II secretion system minor pseudopilin GspI [Ponticaulis koreensis]